MQREFYVVRKLVRTALSIEGVADVVRFFRYIDNAIVSLVKFILMLLGIKRREENKDKFIQHKKNHNYVSHNLWASVLYTIDRCFEGVCLPVSPRYA